MNPTAGTNAINSGIANLAIGPITSHLRAHSLGPQVTAGNRPPYHFGQTGSVASLVAGFNAGHPVPSPPYPSASGSTVRRHDDGADDDGDDDDDVDDDNGVADVDDELC